MIKKKCKNCNAEFKTYPSHIKNGGGIYCSRKCVTRIGKNTPIVGKKYGRLTVMGGGHVQKEKRKYMMWDVKCDCGIEYTVNSNAIVSGKTISCGCYLKEIVSKPFGVAYGNYFYKKYIKGANKRGFSFELKRDQFDKITSQDCFYCGEEPRIYPREFQYINGRTPLNGIDRIDNKIGYTLENSVACCTKCNTMKMTLGVEEFLSHIEKIHNFQKNKNEKFPISYLTVIS